MTRPIRSSIETRGWVSGLLGLVTVLTEEPFVMMRGSEESVRLLLSCGQAPAMYYISDVQNDAMDLSKESELFGKLDAWLGEQERFCRLRNACKSFWQNEESEASHEACSEICNELHFGIKNAKAKPLVAILPEVVYGQLVYKLVFGDKTGWDETIKKVFYAETEARFHTVGACRVGCGRVDDESSWDLLPAHSLLRRLFSKAAFLIPYGYDIVVRSAMPAEELTQRTTPSKHGMKVRAPRISHSSPKLCTKALPPKACLLALTLSPTVTMTRMMATNMPSAFRCFLRVLLDDRI
ncbi:hypothetical protein GNI_036130 [Gregarina niphandrodes]|uniref:Uncharacterized protein n=1 Tax=Gregarina niphandrodes TaxID=110365 RepID=A0A023BAQ0_GRENI|nr:hypothetical protein GNI_036130 [Gregarina niphandrodes]EZG78447.1 hypothetical protein GNI_036130 [Gregarina niphandrodes]|eukprot:XP_011129295.1 hypothetical protein GNI_036130 [Gregarina niphandrodes]